MSLRLLELLERIRADNANPIYWLLLEKYNADEIRKALDSLGY